MAWATIQTGRRVRVSLRSLDRTVKKSLLWRPFNFNLPQMYFLIDGFHRDHLPALKFIDFKRKLQKLEKSVLTLSKVDWVSSVISSDYCLFPQLLVRKVPTNYTNSHCKEFLSHKTKISTQNFLLLLTTTLKSKFN